MINEVLSCCVVVNEATSVPSFFIRVSVTEVRSIDSYFHGAFLDLDVLLLILQDSGIYTLIVDSQLAQNSNHVHLLHQVFPSLLEDSLGPCRPAASSLEAVSVAQIPDGPLLSGGETLALLYMMGIFLLEVQVLDHEVDLLVKREHHG